MKIAVVAMPLIAAALAGIGPGNLIHSALCVVQRLRRRSLSTNCISYRPDEQNRFEL